VLLVRLRWLAVTVQLTVVLVAWLLLDPTLLVSPLLAVVAATAISNVALGWAARSRPGQVEALVRVALIADVMMLTVLLALTGGPSNPFTVLFTVHVALAALLVGFEWTMLVAGLSIAGFAALFVAHVPLSPALGGAHCAGPDAAYSLHLQGMWLAYAIAALTLGTFVSHLSERAHRERENHDRIARHLGLATLAAGAAHEIGNPLGTIKLVATELARERASQGAEPDELRDLALIVSEVERAARAIQALAAGAGELAGEAPRARPLQGILDDLRGAFAEAPLDIEQPQETNSELVSWPGHAVVQALTQLVRNALRVTPVGERVLCRVHVDPADVTFEVLDRGPGFPTAVLERLGEPFVTTAPPGEGMGLGLFVAASLARHLGGSFSAEPRPGGGSAARIRLPRRAP
jgi:two-component system sensor histidine kinase RegB